MRGNTLRLVFVASLVVAACSSSADPSPNASPGSGEAIALGEGVDGDGIADEALPDRVTPPDAAGTDEAEIDQGSGEATGQGNVDGVTMVELLDRIPLPVYEAARGERLQSVEVELTDYNAASDLAGLDRPDASDQDAAFEWLVELTTAASDGSGFAIFPASFPDLNAARLADEVAAELGFSILNVDRAATITAFPQFFAVVEGANVQLSPDLVDLGGGLMSAGEGEDLAQNLDARTAARPFGEPLRLASSGGLVGASKSSSAVEAWLADGPSMLAVDEFAIAAEALDSAGSVTAYLVQADFSGLEFLAEEAAAVGFDGFASPFSTIGIGTTMIDGRGASAVVYVFADESAAATAAPVVEMLWRSAPLAGGDETMADYFDVQTVEQQGRAVLVTATVTEGISTLRTRNLFFRQEMVFTTN